MMGRVSFCKRVQEGLEWSKGSLQKSGDEPCESALAARRTCSSGVYYNTVWKELPATGDSFLRRWATRSSEVVERDVFSRIQTGRAGCGLRPPGLGDRFFATGVQRARRRPKCFCKNPGMNPARALWQPERRATQECITIPFGRYCQQPEVSSCRRGPAVWEKMPGAIFLSCSPPLLLPWPFLTGRWRLGFREDSCPGFGPLGCLVSRRKPAT